MQNNKNNQEELSPELERYLALCQRTYERMVRHGKWPWPEEPDCPDSPDADNMVESEDNQKDL